MTATVKRSEGVTYCRRCVYPATKPGTILDSEGICSGCRAQERKRSYELIMEGLLALQEGHNPKVIGDKLRIYLPDGGAAQGQEDEG